MRTTDPLEIGRFPDHVKVIVRPYTGRAAALVALVLVSVMATHVILSNGGAVGHSRVGVAVVWSIPVFALVIYTAWLLWGRQELTATDGEIRVALKVGVIALGITSVLRRKDITTVRFLEVSNSFRGSRFISRRLVLSDVAGESIRTIALPDRSIASRICSELGLAERSLPTDEFTGQRSP